MNSQKKIYTGIGARKTPHKSLALLRNIATILDQEGWQLRSGGAKGADTAFQECAQTIPPEIYRPKDWKTRSSLEISSYPEELWNKAQSIVRELIPHWNKLDYYGQVLHTRNAFQVLGKDLSTPSKMVVCWTPDGAENLSEITRSTGGTGTAIKLASSHNIPVFNISKLSTRKRLCRWLDKQMELNNSPEP